MQRFSMALAAIFLSVLAITLPVHAGELSGPAPAFSLKNLSGEKVSLSDYKGQVVMINFWASWCGPCREEMPLLNDIYDDYKKAGFVLLGITLDEDISEAQAFLGKTPVTFPILSDASGKVADAYKNQAMPSSYFIDRKGNLAHLHQGYRPGEEAKYKKVIRKLLAQ